MVETMGTVIEVADTIMGESVDLNEAQARSITQGWISDDAKIQRIANSDGRTPREIIRDAVTGMVGEWGAYLYLKAYGIDCEEPDCGVITRDKGCWDKDLLALCDVHITNADGLSLIVDRSISCKAQLYSGTERIGDEEPSWTFQMPGVGHDGYKRHGDPMLLENVNVNKLLIVSWIDDRWKDGYVSYSKCRKPYSEGFCWTPQLSCFWWADVYPYLADPHKKSLIGLKKCLYYKDIKHLQAKINAIQH